MINVFIKTFNWSHDLAMWSNHLDQNMCCWTFFITWLLLYSFRFTRNHDKVLGQWSCPPMTFVLEAYLANMEWWYLMYVPCLYGLWFFPVLATSGIDRKFARSYRTLYAIVGFFGVFFVKTWIFVVNSQTFGQGVREDNSVEESVQYARVTFEYLKGALSAKS